MRHFGLETLATIQMRTPAKKLVELIEIISAKIDSSTDIVWTSYNSVDELLSGLDSLREGLIISDVATIQKLELLFAPTGSFQELSISNG